MEIEKITRSMNIHKTCKLKDIPTKIANFFANFICFHLNHCIDIGKFL